MTSWRPISKIVNYSGSGNWRPGAQTVQGSVDQIRVKSWKKAAKVRVAPPGCKIVDPPEQGLLPKSSSSGELQTLKLTNGNIEVKVMSVFVRSNHKQCSRSDKAITSNKDLNISERQSAIDVLWGKQLFLSYMRSTSKSNTTDISIVSSILSFGHFQSKIKTQIFNHI